MYELYVDYAGCGDSHKGNFDCLSKAVAAAEEYIEDGPRYITITWRFPHHNLKGEYLHHIEPSLEWTWLENGNWIVSR